MTGPRTRGRTVQAPRAARSRALMTAGLGCAALVAGCAGKHQAAPPAVQVAGTSLNAGWWTVAPSTPRPVVLTSLRFSADSTALADSGRATVVDLAGELPRVGFITIAGHTATTDTPDANRRFSALRAGSVRAVLASQGIPTDHILIVGCGQDFPAPVTPGEPAAAQQAANRRVTVWTSDTQLSRAEACR